MAISAANFNVALEALLDRTAYLNAKPQVSWYTNGQSGSWAIPAWMTVCAVYIGSAGGGGGSGSNTPNGGAGGGGGSGGQMVRLYTRDELVAMYGASVLYQAGVGGAGGAGAGANGSDGTPSYFGSLQPLVGTHANGGTATLGGAGGNGACAGGGGGGPTSGGGPGASYSTVSDAATGGASGAGDLAGGKGASSLVHGQAGGGGGGNSSAVAGHQAYGQPGGGPGQSARIEGAGGLGASYPNFPDPTGYGLCVGGGGGGAADGSGTGLVGGRGGHGYVRIIAFAGLHF